MKINIRYPNELSQKILRLEGMGDKAVKLLLSVSTVVHPHESFSLRLAVCDKNGLLASDFAGELKIIAASSGIVEFSIKFDNGQVPVAEVLDLKLAKEGFYRFTCVLEDNFFYSNPVRCTSDPEQPRIYWGDPHLHTALSDCMPEFSRSYNFCYTAARYISGLDWAGTADHVSNGRCELARWKEQCAGTELFNNPPEFVTLPGYEASFQGGKGGDCNYYFDKPISIFVEDYDNGCIKSVCEKLNEMAQNEDFEFFAVPHHTTRAGKHGEISSDIYPGSDLLPVMEIHSKWGSSEYRGNPDELKKVHKGPSFANDFLQKGLKLGFIGGSDAHCSMTFGYGHDFEADHIDRLSGITAVYGDKLCRESIFKGIKNRNCYTTSGDRVYLNVVIAGLTPGQESYIGNINNREIKISSAASEDIKSIEIIRNGKLIKSFKIDDWQAELCWCDNDDSDELFIDSPYHNRFIYYYTRVSCFNGATAWSSPVWLYKPLNN